MQVPQAGKETNSTIQTLKAFWDMKQKGKLCSTKSCSGTGHIIKQLKELWRFPEAKSLPHTLFSPFFLEKEQVAVPHCSGGSLIYHLLLLALSNITWFCFQKGCWAHSLPHWGMFNSIWNAQIILPFFFFFFFFFSVCCGFGLAPRNGKSF